MQCSTPTYIYGKIFPCGNCIQCRLAKSVEWAYRLSCELSYYPIASFITLTYSEENCPLGLCKRDLQLFNKRLRKVLHPRKIKYFACGEYGPQTARPHYHGIYFGLSVTDLELIQNCWKKGFITCSVVNERRIKYVTGYVLKKYSRKENKREYEKKGIEAPFQLCSQGIGLRYCIDHGDVLRDNLGDKYGRSNINLPRYFVRKLDIDTEIISAISVNRQRLLLEKHNKFTNAKVSADDLVFARMSVYRDPITGITKYRRGKHANKIVQEIAENIVFQTNALYKLRERKHVL